MDYYLGGKLEGKPKRAIADYVEKNGILVPRRFDTLAEARLSGKEIFMRSEHPQEYDGMSGLLNSFNINFYMYKLGDSKDAEEVRRRYFEYLDNEKGTALYKQYCKTYGLDEEEFRKQTSFSIWEELKGFNRTVIADSAIQGRYHIMTYCSEDEHRFCNYTIQEDGKVAKEFIKPLTEELRDGLSGLIETYEKVRQLDRFDPNHCPIMEFETVDGKDHFLQYHRTRDFSQATFALEREPENSELEVLFVRGATPKEGLDLKITVYYGKTFYMDAEDEDGSYDLHFNWVFSDKESRRRKLQMISDDDLEFQLLKIIINHNPRSKLFKPQISAIMPVKSLLKDNEVLAGGNEHVSYGDGSIYTPRDPILKVGETIFNFSDEAEKGHNSSMNLHLVSDGRRAFIRRI